MTLALALNETLATDDENPQVNLSLHDAIKATTFDGASVSSSYRMCA